MRYSVTVNVNSGEYKYTQPLESKRASYPSRESALSAIETYLAQAFPDWSESRKSIFRSHCSIKEIAE